MSHLLTLPEIEAMRLRWASSPPTPWPTHAEGLLLAETAIEALSRRGQDAALWIDDGEGQP